MGDIDDFQSRMDEIKVKGHRVIDATDGQPKVKDEVESQLSNLEDSYMSLQATALQIKVSGTMFSFVKRQCEILQNLLLLIADVIQGC